MSFLVGLIIGAFLCIVVLIVYAHTTHKKDNPRDPKIENPLSFENIHDTGQRVAVYTKEYVRKLYLVLLRITLKIKKISRIILDRAIKKLSKLAFPEQKNILPIEENHLLNNTENHKKNGVKGTIE